MFGSLGGLHYVYTMSEKRGNTVKIIHDFDSCKCLEIYVGSLERWHRVTPREFRSFSGKRRITTWDKDDNPIYNEYNGPVYYFMTNKVCKKPDGEKVQHLTEPIPFKKRMFENI
jgi:hypothetical protein